MATFDELEQSDRDGAPLEFMKFAIIGGASWLYNSSDIEITVAGEVYEPLYIKRGGRALSRNSEDSAVRVEVPISFPIIELFKVQPPFQRIYFTQFNMHQGSTETRGFFQGYVGGINFKGDSAEITVNNLVNLMERSSPRHQWQGGCRYFVYDGEFVGGHGCPVPVAPFTVTGLVSLHAGSTIQSPTLALQPDQYYQFGWVELANGYRSMILTHVGDTVSILAPFLTSVQGLPVKFIAGCAQDWDTCKTKFGAYTRDGRDFGGSPRIPKDNPNSTGIR